MAQELGGRSRDAYQLAQDARAAANAAALNACNHSISNRFKVGPATPLCICASLHHVALHTMPSPTHHVLYEPESCGGEAADAHQTLLVPSFQHPLPRVCMQTPAVPCITATHLHVASSLGPSLDPLNTALTPQRSRWTYMACMWRRP